LGSLTRLQRGVPTAAQYSALLVFQLRYEVVVPLDVLRFVPSRQLSIHLDGSIVDGWTDFSVDQSQQAHRPEFGAEKRLIPSPGFFGGGQKPINFPVDASRFQQFSQSSSDATTT